MTVYAHIEDNTITGVYDTLPNNWRNISNFSVLQGEETLLHSLGWRTIVKDNPTYDSVTHRLGNPSYNIVDDDVVETIEILPKMISVEISQPIISSEEQNINLHNIAMSELRIKRDLLLLETDFTQLTDVVRINGVELTQLYDDYRQALRDLPAQYESDMTFLDINQAIFPTKPESV